MTGFVRNGGGGQPRRATAAALAVGMVAAVTAASAGSSAVRAAAAVPAPAPGPAGMPTAAAYATTLGVGITTDWFAEQTLPTTSHAATLTTLQARGFRHVQLRVRADLHGLPRGRFDPVATAALAGALTPVLRDAAHAGLDATVAFVDPPLVVHPTAAGRNAAATWWSDVANRLRSAGPRVSFAPVTELPAYGLGNDRTAYQRWLARSVTAIRHTRGNNTWRVLVLGGAGPDIRHLGWIPKKVTNDRHVVVDWERYLRRSPAGSAAASVRTARRFGVARHVPVLATWTPSGPLADTTAFLALLARMPSTISPLSLVFDEATGTFAPPGSAGDVLTTTLTGVPAGGTAHPTPTPTTSAPPLPVLVTSKLAVAQTHVLPPSGKSWTLTDGTSTTAQESLTLTGGRDTLVLTALSPATATSPQLEAWKGSTKLGAVALAPPSSLPSTEANGPAYATDLFSATLPAAWVQPGVQVRVTSSSTQPSAFTPLTVGADTAMTLRVLPMYVLGATPANTKPLSETGTPNAATQGEMFAKWPASTLSTVQHSAQYWSSPYLVIGPRNDSSNIAQPGYVAHAVADYKDGFAAMSATLSILGGLRGANGDGPQAVQYYSPLLAINGSGQYSSTGGGLGSVGGGTGVGDTSYAGIFIHEQGHAFGLSHAGSAYDAHKYPYLWGSLDGSAWGYDQTRHQLLPPFIPPTASTYSGCAADTFGGHARALDGQGRCVKQDPMQSGAGDQDPSYKFDTFSDFSTAVMQRWLTGKVYRDATFPDGWKTWDAATSTWKDFSTATTSLGLYGLDQNLPVQTNVSVYAIPLTISNASPNDASLTQIYPPLRFTGNLIHTIDPTSSSDRADINPSTGADKWYCDNYGCDYSVKVTYTGGATRTVLLHGAFRPWFHPSDPSPAADLDPQSGSSFATYVVNVPDLGDITSIQLLSTPQAWTGFPASPTVLASR